MQQSATNEIVGGNDDPQIINEEESKILEAPEGSYFVNDEEPLNPKRPVRKWEKRWIL